jgi:hypothetical protein
MENLNLKINKFKFIFLFAFIAFHNNAICQKNNNNLIKCTNWDKKKGIRYHLPDRPALLLDSIITNIKIMNPITSVFVELNINGDTTTITGYTIKQGLKNLNKHDDLKLLLNYSHRFICINGYNIPFYFRSDLYFGFPNFFFSDYKFYIDFVGKKFEDGIIISWELR